MSKYFVLWGLFVAIFLIFPTITNAAPSITTIGNIDPDQSPTITITGLSPTKTYAWETRKFTEANHLPGTDPYTPVNTNCFNSDSTGQIAHTLGPFSIPGYYRLGIFEGHTISSGTCTIVGNKQASQDFSVGGPVGGSTDREKGTGCCDYLAPHYDRNADVCRFQKWAPWDPSTKSVKTFCTKGSPPSFCDPDSLKCFNNKTLVVRGKICKEPDPGPNSDFDPARKIGTDRYIVCASGGGKPVSGCSDDPKSPNPGIATAIGCIHTSAPALVKDLMTFVIGISGGLAFLMMILGAFQMLTSQGNPETLNAGKDRLTSAVIGLLLVIFAILLLQIIGADILQIPGFGK